jgi:hypothetical protein
MRSLASFNNHHYLKNRYPWTHHQGMGKPLELYYEVSWDEKPVYHSEFFWAKSSNPRTYWCWGMKITSFRKWFSSQGQDDEQFRVEPTRSTAWLSLDHEGKSSLCDLPLLFYILLEWNNTWLWHKRRVSPPPTTIMDLGKGILDHLPLAYRFLFDWDKSGFLTRRMLFHKNPHRRVVTRWIMR